MTPTAGPLVGMTTQALREQCARMGLPAFRGSQIADWLYRRILPSQGGGANARFGAMTDLPKAARETFAAERTLHALELSGKEVDSRDATIKIVTRTHDALEIESVLMPDPRRVSVCLSTQAGCPMACAFCATGTQGLARNLSVAEIVGQFLQLQALCERPITHVVFMGMGEPLLNLSSLVDAIAILHSEIGLSMRRITVSTVGVIPGIRKLAELALPINLAVSLHAANDVLRRSIIPKHRDLRELIDVSAAYFEQTGREITFEYILLRGVNDQPDNARELARLLAGFPSCTVNLIPYNATSVIQSFERPDASSVREFRRVLESAGLRVTQRKERGQEIAAACGQLVTQRYGRQGKAIGALPMAGECAIPESLCEGAPA